MINWLKFLPIKLRTDFNATEFQGPEALRSRPVKLTIGGSVLQFSAPRDRSGYPHPPFHVRNRDGMDVPFRSFNSALVANDDWWTAQILSRGWGYWRAWFGGTEGQLSLGVSVIKRKEGKEFDGPSFFHPRTFEYVIANFMDTQFGHEEDEGEPLYKAPVMWKAHKHLPVVAASFKAEGPNERAYFLFPILKDAFVQVVFTYSWTREGIRDRMDSTVSKIIDSMTLKLSPTAQTQLNEVQAGCPDMSLTESFPLFKWPIKPEDIGKGEILKPQNPERSHA